MVYGTPARDESSPKTSRPARTRRPVEACACACACAYAYAYARPESESTRLIILRGNSASGKSAAAAEIRTRYGKRDLAIVGQEHLRRVVLRERDIPGGANIGLIDSVARYALDHGFHTIIEGIFRADH